jgi:competence protein ComEC
MPYRSGLPGAEPVRIGGMRRLAHVCLSVCILLGCVGCDQVTKSLAKGYLQNHPTVSMLGDTFRLQYAENPGAFLSLGASLPHEWRAVLFIVGGTLLVGAAALYAFLSARVGRLGVVALSLICAGGIGNLADRIRYDGRVVDFLNLGVGPVRTGIFNVADMALMLGVALLLYRQLARSPRAAALSVLLVFVIWTAGAQAAPAKSLDIYFIDVEGGQSTLIVTPDRHSLLIDTGWAGDGSNNDYSPVEPPLARDANRILAAAHDAGVKQIDYLLITHFHHDHDGGVAELAQLLPIRGFIDHGVPSPEAARTDANTRAAFDAYLKVRGHGRHLEPKPGDRLPLADVEATVVSSAGSTLANPLPGAGSANATCQGTGLRAFDRQENPRSTGVVVRFGKFRFLDVGDLTGPPLFGLACPKDLIGPVDAYLVAHHGGGDAADPATFAAFRPRVAIMNNGVWKGGMKQTYEVLHHVPGLEDVWQLHRSNSAGDSNYSAPYVANLDESTAYWIKLVANEDGSFRVFNPRTGESKSYAARGR